MAEEQTEQPRQEYDYSRLNGVPIGYTPLPTNVPGQSEGSLWKANFLNNTTIGSFIASPSSAVMSGEVDKELNFVDHIPEDLILNHADKFVGRKIEDFPEIERHIRDEMDRSAIIASRPWASFAVGFAENLVDPVNWLPMGALYKNLKHGTTLARSIIGSGAAGLIGTSVQEAVINRNQLTREASESYANIAASGILAGAMGGLGYGLIRGLTPAAKAILKSRDNAHAEITQTLTDQEKKLDPNGLLESEDLMNMPSFIRKSMVLTPMNRLLNSSFGISKWFANAMYQKGYRLNKHATLDSEGADVESLIRLDMGKAHVLSLEHQNHYFDMVGITGKAFRGTRAKLANVDMTLDQFNTAVWQRLSTQVDHERPQVNAAARMWEDKLIEPTFKRAVELNILPEDASPRNALGYVMQVYNKALIVEQGGRSARGGGTFPQALYDNFKVIQEEIKAFKDSPEYQRLTGEIKSLNEKLTKLEEQKRATPKPKKDRIKKFKDDIETTTKRLDEVQKEFKDKAPKRGLDSKGKLFEVVDDETLWSHVEQTVDNILGDSQGKIGNQILARLKGSPKPLKERKMTVDQTLLQEWSITDIPRIMAMYTRAMHPLIRLTELAQKNGAKDIAEFQSMLNERMTNEYNMLAQGKTGADAQKIRKQRDSNIQDMNATLELLQGVYGDGPNTLNSSAQQFYRNFLKWNYVRLLGYMTISSIADAGMQVFVHGPYRFIHDGLVKSFSEARKLSNTDLRGIGYGIETDLGTRISSWADTDNLSVDPGPFTKGLDVLTQKFGNLSLMNQWNGWHQRMAGHMGINRSLETIHNFMEGKKVPKKELERLVRDGVQKENWETIYKFTKNNKTEDGAYFADWGNWDIQTKAQRDALEQFQAHIAKEIDSIVIVPGLGDKSLLSQTIGGKLLFQFKTFAMAATNRLLYSGIQRRDDINVYMGVISMLGFGALSYLTTSLLKDKDVDLSFKNLSREAVDRSGLLGIYGEMLNTGAKLTGFGGVSRYQSRDLWGALSGPTGGALSEVLSLVNKTRSVAAGDEEVTTKDAEKIKRLFPMQNLFYLDKINRYLTRNTALAAGAKDAD